MYFGAVASPVEAGRSEAPGYINESLVLLPCDRSFSHQRAVLEQNSDEDPWIKAGGSKRSEPGCVCLGLPNSMQGIMSPLISVNVTSHQTEGGEWEKCNCITNLTLPPR